jgi:hypothetical protein
MEHESKVGRRFVFPVKIDDCAPPSFIEERIYADFRSSFSDPLSRLVAALEKNGARTIVPEPNQEVICLSFTKQTNFDRSLFLRNVRAFHARHPGVLMSSDQVKVIDDPEYIALKQRLHARIDNLEHDRWWSRDLESDLKEIPARVQREEERLVAGAVSIVNSDAGPLALGEALHWFLKFTRSRLCYELYRCQYPDPSALKYGKDCGLVWGMYGADEMARFYEVKKVFRVHAWSTKYYPDYESVYIGTDQLHDEVLRQQGSISYASGLEDYCLNEAFCRYVLPQALYWTLSHQTHREVWRQEDVIIGPP